MDIKSKSKYLYITIFVAGIYILSLSFISTIDFIGKKHFLEKNAYFDSYNFKYQLEKYSENVKYSIDYLQNFDIKSDNKEIQVIAENHEIELQNKLHEIEKQYQNKIEQAQKQGNDIDTLINEKNKKLEETKLENIKNIKTKASDSYEKIKKYIDSQNFIRYYIKDRRNGKIYTNLPSGYNIQNYIKDKALYNISFPINNIKDEYMLSINEWFKSSNLEGDFIILKDINGNSQIEKDYRYYNAIRQRLIKEGIICVFSFVIGATILAYLIKNKKYEMPIIDKLENLYKKVPFDLKIFILVIFSFILLAYQRNINFFYLPIGIDHVKKLTIVAIYIFYLLINIKTVLILIRYPKERKVQLQESLICKFGIVIKECFLVKNVMIKVSKIFIMTILMGFFLCIAAINFYKGPGFIFLVSIVYIIIYIFFVPQYILKKVALLNKIIKGTNEIVLGNLDYTIDNKAKGELSKLADNINNMKDGFKKSVESQVKSERLKSELITNVSHDLKTPLTSIINYIDLLRKEELSNEDREAYIKVLDKKSQRLKTLIDDLFEASKIASGSVELNIQRVDIVAILRQAMGEFNDKINNSSLKFRIKLPKKNIYMNLDGKRTWRVFENLIGNILKYSMDNTRVYINLEEEDNKVRIVMKNISAYEMDFDVEEIFERFKRGDKSRNTEGSGLGLAIAKSIVELQGGNMNIEVDGDLFKVSLEFNKS
ncbi:HAMP domain-containing sensor histidine kinase [Clostridium brassicae]|uniref:histidine kinase n=1 Tax=Clostridium brassicae TaxID=2999072 RepID=A0ABT4DBU9_9CLOT|nr:histidine kinase dimerization/phospho-acceptor domain-containing protein [Clostridium brassicae]MCY6959777.1 ATP-binding protein [Clostridium brassicae]